MLHMPAKETCRRLNEFVSTSPILASGSVDSIITAPIASPSAMIGEITRQVYLFPPLSSAMTGILLLSVDCAIKISLLSIILSTSGLSGLSNSSFWSRLKQLLLNLYLPQLCDRLYYEGIQHKLQQNLPAHRWVSTSSI